MTTYLAASGAGGISQPTPLARTTQAAAQWLNRIAIGAAVGQFYTAGLAIFGASGFMLHARVGWLVQVCSLVTIIMLLIARVPFRVTRLAILILVLAVLQPVLAFAFRASAPALSALHPVNGIAILGVCILLDKRLRGVS